MEDILNLDGFTELTEAETEEITGGWFDIAVCAAYALYTVWNLM